MAYTITFAFRNMKMTEATKATLQEKVEEKLAHYASRIVQVDVELAHTASHRGVKSDYSARLLVQVPKATIRIKKEASDVIVALDEALSSLATKLEDYKDLLQHWHSEEQATWVEPHVLEDDDKTDGGAQYSDYQPVVRVKQLSGLPPITLAEALFQMEMLGRSAFLFRNSQTGLIEMLRKEEDEYVLTRPPQL